MDKENGTQNINAQTLPKKHIPLPIPLVILLLLTLILLPILIAFLVLSQNNNSKNNSNATPTSTIIEITSTVTTSITTQTPSPTVTTTTQPAYLTFTENTQKWSIQYPNDWNYSKQSDTTSQNPGQSYYELFSSPKTEVEKTQHQGLFSVKQSGGGQIGTYDHCVEEANSGGGGAGAGHTFTVPVKFSFNGYNACKYTETSTDGIVKFVDTYTFVKDPKSGRIASFSYAEDSLQTQHNYDTKDWIYSDKFDYMEKSFKFI